jgi:hypothetical protein
MYGDIFYFVKEGRPVFYLGSSNKLLANSIYDEKKGRGGKKSLKLKEHTKKCGSKI